MMHMIQQLAKSIGLLVIIITTALSCTRESSKDCDEILISPISNQVMYENTRIYIPISVASNSLENIKFNVIGSPFISKITTQRGRCILALDPSSDHVGSHSITIEVNNGAKYGCLNFDVLVKPIDKSKRLIHCKPNLTENDIKSNIYSSLEALINSEFTFDKNDIIVLHAGKHGDIKLSGSNYEIVSAAESEARLTSISVHDAHNISISGLNIQPVLSIGMHDTYLFYIDSLSDNIAVTNNLVSSIKDSEKWTESNWNQSAARGIKCLGNNTVIKNNTIQNIFHGIKTEGDNINVSYNHVDRFGGDAIRNTGSNNIYTHNFLTNATIDDYYDEGGNHDDLFQSWTFDKPIDNIKLENNIMISCLDTLMPLRAKIVQGLVCFDGFETNWIVDNNLIITDHPHGIALYGAENCQITNNTVLKNPHNLYKYESDPWIMVNNHKDGRKSMNNTVKNNKTTALSIVADDVDVSGNIVLDSIKRQELINYDDWDFRFKK